jgi:hypothetical protein
MVPDLGSVFPSTPVSNQPGAQTVTHAPAPTIDPFESAFGPTPVAVDPFFSQQLQVTVPSAAVDMDFFTTTAQSSNTQSFAPAPQYAT